jgi:transposase
MGQDKPTVQDIAIHFALVDFNTSITEVAQKFNTGRGTVIRAMHRVKEHGVAEVLSS